MKFLTGGFHGVKMLMERTYSFKGLQVLVTNCAAQGCYYNR